MSNNVTVANSYTSSLNDIPVRTTEIASGANAGKQVQHVFIDSLFISRQDDVSASVSYYGWAVPGTSVASALWRIMKKDVSGTETFYLFADGNTDFDNVWDNRAALS